MTYNEIIKMVMDSFLISFILVFISLLLCYFYKKAKNEKWNNPLRLGFFLLYLYMLLYVTVFRGGLFQGSYRAINLLPFDELLTSSYYQAIVVGKISGFIMFSYNVFGNIIWFIPFGVLLCTYLKTVKLQKVIIYSLLLSLSIEIMQFCFYTGVSDIDDIIFNVIGGICGYLIYHFMRVNKRRNLCL
ncbi:MAG: VanZ family protein [Erysipelotrichia bacterium]|nr:VanZ family protein [Erysipelotrichia bacterium]NCC53940.1 VanZ family protein [Erysipelotrichia bacterium]